jgi:hypothetical protein
MARGSKHSKDSQPTRSTVELLELILNEVIRVGPMSPAECMAEFTTPQFPPPIIPVSDGRGYQASQAAIDAAHELTSATFTDRRDLQQTLAPEAFARLSWLAIGAALAASPTHLNPAEGNLVGDAFYAAMESDYRSTLESLVASATVDIYRHIPCDLFHPNQGVPPFNIGPVQFLTRDKWLARFVPSQKRRDYVQQVSDGHLSPKQLLDLSTGNTADRDAYAAWTVVNFLRAHDWVASILIERHEPAQSHHKATVLVGLALDALGLLFEAQDAIKLTKAGRQHLYSEDRLATGTNGEIYGGASVQMPSLGAAPGYLAKLIAGQAPFLGAAGKVLDAYVQGRETGEAPNLVERWAKRSTGSARRAVKAGISWPSSTTGALPISFQALVATPRRWSRSLPTPSALIQTSRFLARPLVQHEGC